LGSLTLNIQWKPRGGGADRNEPCPDSCRDLICEAIESGLDIKICDGGQPNTPPCQGGKWQG